jgi:heme O synthase-like polyprenyltransferase
VGYQGVTESETRPAFYALERGGWRDYVTLLHLPYTAWHLSYVVIGGCLAPAVAWGRLGAAVGAFALALGVGAHALDELRGRPLRTQIPSGVLVGLAVASVAVASAVGIVVLVRLQAWLVILVPIGVFLAAAYNLELLGGRFHSDLWFGLAWGAFPLLCGYAAVAGEIRVEALLAAAFAVLLSLAQRMLSSHVRHVRREVATVQGELVLADGTREPLDVAGLISPAERGLRLLTAATVALAAALVVVRL